MKTTRIGSHSTTKEIALLKSLYEEAFPQEERIEFNDLMRLSLQMPLTINLYHKDGNFIGITVFLERKDFNWFWYFAVQKHLRGQGYGQQILSEMLRQYDKRPMIIDAESPFQQCANSKQRTRRYNFYLRNGFCDTGVGRTFEGITYCILLHGEGSFTMSDYDRILSELRSHWATMPQPEQ